MEEEPVLDDDGDAVVPVERVVTEASLNDPEFYAELGIQDDDGDEDDPQTVAAADDVDRKIAEEYGKYKEERSHKVQNRPSTAPPYILRPTEPTSADVRRRAEESFLLESVSSRETLAAAREPYRPPPRPLSAHASAQAGPSGRAPAPAAAGTSAGTPGASGRAASTFPTLSSIPQSPGPSPAPTGRQTRSFTHPAAPPLAAEAEADAAGRPGAAGRKPLEESVTFQIPGAAAGGGAPPAKPIAPAAPAAAAAAHGAAAADFDALDIPEDHSAADEASEEAAEADARAARAAEAAAAASPPRSIRAYGLDMISRDAGGPARPGGAPRGAHHHGHHPHGGSGHRRHRPHSAAAAGRPPRAVPVDLYARGGGGAARSPAAGGRPGSFAEMSRPSSYVAGPQTKDGRKDAAAAGVPPWIDPLPVPVPHVRAPPAEPPGTRPAPAGGSPLQPQRPKSGAADGRPPVPRPASALPAAPPSPARLELPTRADPGGEPPSTSARARPTSAAPGGRAGASGRLRGTGAAGASPESEYRLIVAKIEAGLAVGKVAATQARPWSAARPWHNSPGGTAPAGGGGGTRRRPQSAAAPSAQFTLAWDHTVDSNVAGTPGHTRSPAAAPRGPGNGAGGGAGPRPTSARLPQHSECHPAWSLSARIAEVAKLYQARDMRPPWYSAGRPPALRPPLGAVMASGKVEFVFTPVRPVASPPRGPPGGAGSPGAELGFTPGDAAALARRTTSAPPERYKSPYLKKMIRQQAAPPVGTHWAKAAGEDLPRRVAEANACSRELGASERYRGVVIPGPGHELAIEVTRPGDANFPAQISVATFLGTLRRMLQQRKLERQWAAQALGAPVAVGPPGPGAPPRSAAAAAERERAHTGDAWARAAELPLNLNEFESV